MSDLENRKQMGRAHLNANRLELALGVFAQLVEEYPEDVECLVILGDCYLAGADYQTSQELYQRALDLQPEAADIQRRIQLTSAELLKQEHLPDSFRLPTSKDSLSMLLQELTGRTSPVKDDEIHTAADLLQEMVNSSHPADVVAGHLDKIDVLLPALLELNIKQAEADGKPDLAAALLNLQENIQIQKGSFTNHLQPIAHNSPDQPSRPLNILLLKPSGKQPPRAEQVRQSLEASEDFQLHELEAGEKRIPSTVYDVVIAFNPHGDSGMLKHLADLSSEGIPIVLDLETDFENLPVRHPLYPEMGLGSAARAKTFAACMSLADLVTTSSTILAAQLESNRRRAIMIPDAWNRANTLWEKPFPTRQTVNIGWIGTPGHLEDTASVRRSVVRILREFPQTQLVISGDPKVYQLFDSIPEYRRIFLPEVSKDDYPSLLSQLDVRLVPLLNTVYNRSASDLPLMEAGIRGIPWVASPVPSHEEWKAGGRIAKDREDWYLILKEYIENPELIMKLGQEGQRAAAGREIRHTGTLWISLLKKLATDPSGMKNQQSPVPETPE